MYNQRVKIRELTQDIYCNIEHGECLCDEKDKQVLINQIIRLQTLVEELEINKD